MSFIDDIGSIGSFFTGDSIGSTLARTALLGYTINRLNQNVGSGNNLGDTAASSSVDTGVRLQVNPGTQNKIPIVYGAAYLGSIITDAQITNNNKTMTYCMTICEKTGDLYSTGRPSDFTFRDIYWNDQRIVFNSDGITANYTVDRDNNVDYSIQNLVKIWCYAGSSANPVVPDGYTNVALSQAYTHMPNWTTNHTMNDLIFAIVEVNYNKEKNVTNIPTINFHIENSMTLPGDCLYDYMTNTRYGAGIKPSEIYAGGA